jgi:hypothetical protein
VSHFCKSTFSLFVLNQACSTSCWTLDSRGPTCRAGFIGIRALPGGAKRRPYSGTFFRPPLGKAATCWFHFWCHHSRFCHMNQQSKLVTPDKRWENQLRSGTGPGGRTHYNQPNGMTARHVPLRRIGPNTPFQSTWWTSWLLRWRSSPWKKLEYKSSDATPHL